jgi:anion transporter
VAREGPGDAADALSPAGTALLAGILVAAAALLALPPLLDGLTARGQRSLIVAALTVALWTRRTPDPGTTSLLGIVLLAVTGAAADLRDALQGFANPVPYFLLGVLAMGAAVARSGLAERLARAILRRARGSAGRLYLDLVLAMPVLTLVLPSATTRTGILVHVYEDALALAQVRPGPGLTRAVMLALTSINRLASTALLTGGITPVMSAALIGGIGWTRWLVLMAVPYYALLGLGAALIWVLDRRHLPPALAAAPPRAPRPLSGAEARTLAIVLGASVLWLTDALHHLDPALPALLALVALLAPGVGVLRWRDLDRDVGWATVAVVAASISIARTLVDSGAATWLAARFLGGIPALAARPAGTVVLLMLGATALRALIPNITGFLALALPVAMSIGAEAGLNPLVCALVVLMTGDAVLYYPVQTASALVVYQRGHVSAADIARFGMLMTLVAYIAILAVALPYWSLVGEPLMPGRP